MDSIILQQARKLSCNFEEFFPSTFIICRWQEFILNLSSRQWAISENLYCPPLDIQMSNAIVAQHNSFIWLMTWFAFLLAANFGIMLILEVFRDGHFIRGSQRTMAINCSQIPKRFPNHKNQILHKWYLYIMRISIGEPFENLFEYQSIWWVAHS